MKIALHTLTISLLVFITGYAVTSTSAYIPMQYSTSRMPSIHRSVSPSYKITKRAKSSIKPAIQFATIASFFFSTTSASAVPVDLTRGEILFQQNCITCHMGGKNAIAKVRNLQQEALEKFIHMENANSISDFVKDRNLHRGALVFSGRMSEADYNDVAAFVYKQAMENAW